MPPSRLKLRRDRLRRAGGYGAVDLIVGLLVAVVVGLFVIMGLTRTRESARAMVCQRNLSAIGLALAYRDDAQGSLPTVGEPASIEPPGEPASPGPLKVLLESLGVANFLGLDAQGRELSRVKAPLPVDAPVAGFLCPSDSEGLRSAFSSPVSYRAATGDDPSGRNGGFAIGRRISLKEIEAGDGKGFTAAFSERLIGDGRPRPGPSNYALADEAVVDENGSIEPTEPAAADWRGDAGSSWLWADYRTTLYNHALPPSSGPSLVARDGRSALMGASSGHVRGVHLLMFDGSTRVIAPSIDRNVWRSLATVEAPPSPAADTEDDTPPGRR